MKTWVRYGKGRLEFTVPDGDRIVQTPSLEPLSDPTGRINEALDHPIDSEPLAVLARRLSPQAKVVLVISDISRPVPNQQLLEPILATLEAANVERQRITILIATGMHRPTSTQEKIELVGERISGAYRLVDHCADDPQVLVALNAKTPNLFLKKQI